MPCSLTTIREQVALQKGATVRYRASKGRRKVEERQGVILETYPKIFTLYVASQNSTVSFSYAELLTHEVEMEIISGEQRPL
ncbi:MAG: Veg family protein [Synergistales bacterium]|nr:Veg family protein [Synergistales bacterium]